MLDSATQCRSRLWPVAFVCSSGDPMAIVPNSQDRKNEIT
jgi:hypothetical protein